MSHMREAMQAQPTALRRVLEDTAPVAAAAERVRGRRVLLVGTGTSWHAAQQGVWLLRQAGVEASAVPAADAALGGPMPGPDDALVLLTHRGTKHHTSQVLQAARAAGTATVTISKIGNPDADLDTSTEEQSSAFTVSHVCALMRLAQLATELGGSVGDLSAVPGAVEAELAAGPTGVTPPRRLLEFIGSRINASTAAEGALKARETSYVACSGGNAEQFLHGPSVALGEGDTLVVLDGGGPEASRLADIGTVITAQGATVHHVRRTALGEPLSIFPLTVVVQKIAVELAEALGTNPDSFGKDLPGRAEAWASMAL
jgi:glucosamine--fructose-6-phosphate aminotransferase (isomerizing)